MHRLSIVRSLRQSRQIQSSMELQPGGKPQEGNTCKISQYMQAVRSSQTDTSSLASSAAAETAPRIIARPTSSTRSTCQGRTPLLEATLSRHLRRVRRAGGSLPRRGRADDLQERGAHHHEQEEAEQQRPNRDLVLVPLRRVSRKFRVSVRCCKGRAAASGSSTACSACAPCDLC